jgi:hypothetical protein
VFDKQLNSNNFKFGEKSCGECTTILWIRLSDLAGESKNVTFYLRWTLT